MCRLFVLLLLPVAAFAAAEQKAPLTVRLHAEATAHEGETFVLPVTLMTPPKQTFIRRVPIVTEKDFVTFYPFAANDSTVGCYFKLDANGTNKLHQHTVEKLDSLVVAMINGRVACAMQVGGRVSDGILLIPSGFHPREIVELQAKFPIIGREKEFEAQQKKAKAALAEAKKNEPKASSAPKTTP
jgi:hypothetical protein